jgi:hypothetical protein
LSARRSYVDMSEIFSTLNGSGGERAAIMGGVTSLKQATPYD